MNSNRVENSYILSVVVLTYNQQESVGRTLDSILAQETGYKYEVIIGEDGSSDNTRAVCEEYVAKYPNVRLLPKAPNKGLLKNYSDCLEATTGKYIASCAGDDWWHNTSKIEKQLSFLEQNPDYVLSYGGAIFYNVANGLEKVMKAIKPKEDLFDQLMRGCFLVAGTVCFRRSMLKHIDFGLYRELGFMMEDYPMWLTMCRYGKFHCIDAPLISYSLNSGSICNASDLDKQELFEYSAMQCRLYFFKHQIGCKINEQKLWDKYFRQLAFNGVRYGNREYTRLNLLKIKHKMQKDYIKIVLCYSNWGFNYIVKKNPVFSI